MIRPATLKYHQATFDLLGIAPVTSEAALKAIEQAEEQARRKLPASVCEWYSLANSAEIPAMCCEEGKGKSICQSLSLGDFLRAWEKLRGNKHRTAPLKVLDWVGGGAEWHLDLKTKEDDPRVQNAISFDGKAHER